MPIDNFLDPLTVAQLGNLELKARRILDGLYSGRHVNKTRGHAQDFSEHKPYNPGDEPKTLDWKVFARTDRLVVRHYEEQTNMGVTIVLDDSASMNFSWNGRTSKLEYAKMMSAALAYLVNSQRDAIGLLSTSTFLPYQSHPGVLEQFFNVLDTLKPAGAWALDRYQDRLLSSIKKKSFVLVFSDFMADESRVEAFFRALRSKKHEVIAFQVLDAAEIEFPFEGPLIVEDMESGQTIRTDADTLRADYVKKIQDRLQRFVQMTRGLGVDTLLLRTDTTFDKGLGAYLAWRERHQ